ncbi:MAG: hypothetical protein ACFWT6_18085 [Virgibacillus proomii]|jgi:hypothetical protein
MALFLCRYLIMKKIQDTIIKTYQFKQQIVVEFYLRVINNSFMPVLQPFDILKLKVT